MDYLKLETMVCGAEFSGDACFLRFCAICLNINCDIMVDIKYDINGDIE
jgi:hypothetical protein